MELFKYLLFYFTDLIAVDKITLQPQSTCIAIFLISSQKHVL